VNLPVADGVAFRLNALVHQSDVAGRDGAAYERVGIAPSLAVGLDTPTQLLISFLHQSEWDRPDYGVPWIDIGSAANISHPAPVPPNNFYGFNSDYVRITADIATATVSREFGDAVKLRDQCRYASYQRNYRATNPQILPVIAPAMPLSDLTVTRVGRGGFSTETFLGDQIDLTAAFTTFGVTHALVFGGEFGRQTSDPTVLKYSGIPGTSLLSPNPDQPFAGIATPKTIASFTADTQAVYATDTLTFDDRWEFTAAARLDRFDAAYSNRVPTVTSFNHVDLRPSWRGALVYKATDDLSLYGTYGTSFDPSAEGLSLSASTADLSPERSHTIEAGVKWDFKDRVLFSAALFRTLMVNLREPSPADTSVTILAGNARSEGVELEAQGHVTDRWLVLAGYTYLNASVISSPDADVGARLQNTPRHSVKAWSAYDLANGITIGGGIEYQSSRVPGSFADPNGFLQQVPGYWTASALVKYQVSDSVSVQLNLDNLADERYYDNLDDNHVNVSAGRSARLTLAIHD
jgi:catecholate siderophore receptor